MISALLGFRPGGTIDAAAAGLPESVTDVQALAEVVGNSYATASLWADRGTGAFTGALKTFTDIGPSPGTVMRWDGTYWRVLAPTVLIFDTELESGDLSGNNQVIKNNLVPAGLFRCGRYFECKIQYHKSATTETSALSILFGSAGTTADSAITAAFSMAAGNRSYGINADFFFPAATTLETLGLMNGFQGFVGAGSSTAYPRQYTSLPSIDSTAIYLSAAMDQSSTAETPAVSRMILTAFP